MTKLEVVEYLIHKTPCPVCLHIDHQVVLNCDLPSQPCDHIAECQNCGHKIMITKETKRLDELFPQVKEYVEKQKCPKCVGSELVIEYSCDKNTKDCFFLARCADSDHYIRIDADGIRYLFG